MLRTSQHVRSVDPLAPENTSSLICTNTQELQAKPSAFVDQTITPPRTRLRWWQAT